jgi:hypothetical protein
MSNNNKMNINNNNKMNINKEINNNNIEIFTQNLKNMNKNNLFTFIDYGGKNVPFILTV